MRACDVPRRSTVYTLTEGLREELDRRIIAAGFGRYADHAAWLAGEGRTLSLAALQRYGRRLQRSVEQDGVKAREAASAAIARVRQTTEIARAIEGAAGDPLDISARTASLCMARLYELAASEDIDARTLQAISPLAQRQHARRGGRARGARGGAARGREEGGR